MQTVLTMGYWLIRLRDAGFCMHAEHCWHPMFQTYYGRPLISGCAAQVSLQGLIHVCFRISASVKGSGGEHVMFAQKGGWFRRIRA